MEGNESRGTGVEAARCCVDESIFGEKQKPWFVALDNFCSVNSPIKANFKLTSLMSLNAALGPIHAQSTLMSQQGRFQCTETRKVVRRLVQTKDAGSLNFPLLWSRLELAPRSVHVSDGNTLPPPPNVSKAFQLLLWHRRVRDVAIFPQPSTVLPPVQKCGPRPFHYLPRAMFANTLRYSGIALLPSCSKGGGQPRKLPEGPCLGFQPPLIYMKWFTRVKIVAVYNYRLQEKPSQACEQGETLAFAG